MTVGRVKDGLSTTGLAVETGRDVGPWLRGGPATVRGIDPAEAPLAGDGRPVGGTHCQDSTVFRRQKPTGSQVLLGDGSVRSLRDDPDPVILAALATVAGGEADLPGW